MMYEQHVLLREIAALLTSRAPIGWRRLELCFRCTISVSTATYLVTNAHGVAERSPTPNAALRAMHQLRGDMSDEERGSWFTAVLVIEPPSRYEVSFDYDNEPEFVPPLRPDAWLLDFEYFPRTDENTPDWLRAKLAEGGAGTG